MNNYDEEFEELDEFLSSFPNLKKIPESPMVLCIMGYKYENGIDVDRSIPFAKYYYEKAAELNYAIAFFKLGIFYFNGIGTTKDRLKAKELFSKARDLGHEKANTYLEKYYK